MGKHLPEWVKLRIVHLRRSGVSPTEIVRLIQQDDGISVTRKSVYNVFEKWEKHKTVKDLRPQPKPREGVTEELLDYIDSQMASNDELSAKSLQGMIAAEFNEHFSVSKVKDLRRKLGWVAEKTRYCQMVREANQLKRKEFAQKCLETNEEFDDVIWTDECNVQLDWNGVLTFHRWWEPCPQKGKPKHPFKVSVWAAISKRGASELAVFTGIMEKTFFCNEIILKTLLPFIKSTFPTGHRFMQDNDPKHTSKLAKEVMAENNINWLKTPPESPDMNPIENLWHELKNHLRSRVKPRNKEELLEGLKGFWETVTPAKCQKYIGHLRKVLPVVVDREGKASGF